MIDAFWVALFALTTALGLIRESTKKTTWYMRFRWFLMSLPFWWACGVYVWIGYFVPPLEESRPLVRETIFGICFLASAYFLVDAIEDFVNYRKKRGHK